jgi:hypothetical protein
VWWGFNLDIATRPEITILSFGKIDNQFFNKCLLAIVLPDRTFPFLDIENFSRNTELHILLDANLTTQTETFFCLTFRDKARFGRQNVTTTIKDMNMTLATATTATARGRDKNAMISQCPQELSTRLGSDRFSWIIINEKVNFTAGNQALARHQNDGNQN